MRLIPYKKRGLTALEVCQSSIEINSLQLDQLASSRLMSLDQTSKLDGSHCFISFGRRSPTRLAR